MLGSQAIRECRQPVCHSTRVHSLARKGKTTVAPSKVFCSYDGICPGLAFGLHYCSDFDCESDNLQLTEDQGAANTCHHECVKAFKRQHHGVALPSSFICKRCATRRFEVGASSSVHVSEAGALHIFRLSDCARVFSRCDGQNACACLTHWVPLRF